jgi:hypothetical protein
MAYFSNSSEGYVLDELCMKCVHGYDHERGVNRTPDGMACAVWVLQGMWNYEQHSRLKEGEIVLKHPSGATIHKPIGVKTRKAQLKKQALDILLPQTEDILCAMFYEVKNERSNDQ